MEKELLSKTQLFVVKAKNAESQQLSITPVMKEAYKFMTEQYEAKQNMQNKGVIFMEDGCTAKLADSFVNGEYLELNIRCIKNDGNQLIYVLFESDGVLEYGVERREQRITGKLIENQRIEIDNIIKSFTGVYDNAVSSIKVYISLIHKYRLLKGIQSIHNERLPMELIISNLKEWLLLHASDNRLGITRICGEERIVLVCPSGYKKGVHVGGIFKEIFYEIAPDNNFGAFKAELFRRKMLICDKNDQCIDIQKTISRSKCVELGTNHVKIICFDFGEEFVEQMKLAKLDVNEMMGLSDEEIELMFDEGDMLASIYTQRENKED